MGAMRQSTTLSDRAVICVEGAEARSFLQGLITNDMGECGPGRALYAGLLTPQGKLLFEFFVVEASPERFLLDVAAHHADALVKRLTFFRLRAKLLIRRTELAVVAIWNGDGVPAPAGDALIFGDPRLPALGWRMIGTTTELAAFGEGSPADYHHHRIGLGVPDSADLPSEQVFPLDAGFEELNGVSFRKGCYVGQEVTARMKHRGTARRRLLIAEGSSLPGPGTEVESGGLKLGMLAGGQADRALALVRLDRLAEAEAAAQPITAAGSRITLRKPEWLRV
jgi:folate-binding protein YgfZ